jgi:hypothetical protein
MGKTLNKAVKIGSLGLLRTAGGEESPAQKKAKLDDFSKRMKSQAFKTPEANRLSNEAIANRKEQEARKAETSQQATSARQQQQNLIQELQNRAAGTGSSQAQRDLNEASARQKAQLQAQLASRAGFRGGANARAAARAAAGIQRQTAQQREQLQAQQGLQAQQQLANQITQQRQQDVQQQQQATAGQLQSQGLEQGLQEAEQQALAQGATAAVQRSLAEQGAALQADIARTQRRNQQSGALGALAGTAAGALLTGGSPQGAAIGGQVGGMLAFNKGGIVPKMSKKEAFGYKKALEAKKNKNNKKSTGGQVRLTGNDLPTDVNTKIERATRSEGMAGRKAAAKEQSKQATKDIQKATADQRQSRAQQAQLADQLRARQSGAQRSLTSINTKAATNKNLAQQLAAQGRARKSATPAQLAAATQAASQQQLAQTAQAGLQEQAQVGGLLGQTLGQTRGLDINQENFARQMARNQLAQEQAVRESQRGLQQQQASLDIREVQALNALEAQRAAAPKRQKFLGLFNQGGKVPGKAKVKGDSEKNDFVPALLSPGEIVIPRTVVKKGDEAMLGFIKGLKSKMKKNKAKKYNEGGMVEDFAKKKLEESQKKNKIKILGQGNDETSSSFSNKAASEGTKKAVKNLKSSPVKGDAKKSKGITQEQAAAASGALSALGAMRKAKENERAETRQREKRVFDRALSEIRGMSKFSKGGIVKKSKKCCYGDVIKAKKELMNKKRK